MKTRFSTLLTKCFMAAQLLSGLASCSIISPKTDIGLPCNGLLQGKIISTTNPCAGMVIQVVGGEFDPEMVDARWTVRNIAGDILAVHENVFFIYPYCGLSDKERGMLAEAMEKQSVFAFEFQTSDNGQPGKHDTACAICDMWVPLPSKRQSIRITNGQCPENIE